MERRILVYGYGDTSEHGFPTSEHLMRYLAGEIFSKWKRRYQYSQQKDADVIVLSRKGLAYGHLIVEAMEKPNKKDREVYPRVRKTYVISQSHRYQSPVKLSALGIGGYQFGKYISEDQFVEIQDAAGTVHKYQP